jgi:galactokinase/mevalonate kinase-like predicted kinase
MMDGSRAPAGWKRARRLSFADLMRLADADRTAREDHASHRLTSRARTPLERARIAAETEALATSVTSRARARASALAAVGESASTDLALPAVVRRFAVRPDQAVWASAPVRIDLAGGWSDTPPLCIEHGGAVVNAAITLGGTLPLQAMVRVTEEPAITLHSVDAGRTARYAHVRTLLDHHDPRAWDALPRAALVLSGLVPREPRTSLRSHLERAGGGLAITLFSAVPRGSGLGTSSILGATLLATLERVAGRTPDRARLARGASLLEQMIRTRGGWQDQAGGLWGGLKLCTSAPGAEQAPEAVALAAPPAFTRALRERSILFYSGHRRMARNILETVVLRYLRGDPQVLEARQRLVAGARRMAAAVEAGDLDEFTVRLAEYRDLKRAVDPASVTPALEGPMSALAQELSAWSFAGAGGGGFLLAVARSSAAAARVRARLTDRPPHPHARCFPLEFDAAGLRLSVL